VDGDSSVALFQLELPLDVVCLDSGSPRKSEILMRFRFCII
jgi:hypothetical protein